MKNVDKILSDAIHNIVTEELKHYDKIQFKHIKKQTPDKVEKDRKAVEDESNKSKKQKFLEELTDFVQKYRMKTYTDEELIDALFVLGKFANAKKNTIKDNVEKYKRRSTITPVEVVELLIGKIVPEDKEEVKPPTKTELKKNDPERAKEVKEEKPKRADGHFKVKDDAKSNVSSKDGNVKGKPKGVKEMPTKAKTAKGVTLMKETKKNCAVPPHKIKKKEINESAVSDAVYLKNKKDITKDIKGLKNILIKKWKSKGGYENFGQKELRYLIDKYGFPMPKEVEEFQNWIESYDGHEIDEGAFDRTVARVKGGVSAGKTVGKNLIGATKAAVKGEKFKGKDPKLAAGITMLKQKAKIINRDIKNSIEDLNKLIGSDMEKRHPIFKKYKNKITSLKTFNDSILNGDFLNDVQITFPLKQKASND